MLVDPLTAVPAGLLAMVTVYCPLMPVKCKYLTWSYTNIKIKYKYANNVCDQV